MNALRKVVALTAAIGLLLQVSIGWLLHDTGPVVPDDIDGAAWSALPPWGLLLVLLGLLVVGDLVAVPVRRGEQVEELTLFEAAVVVGALLLPARDALWLPVVGLAVGSVLARRDPLKTAFNLGNQSAATACLVAMVHVLSGPDEGLSARTVLGVGLGMLLFSAVNLVGLTRVLAAVGETDAVQVLRDGARLALLSAAVCVAVAGGGVLAATHAPALLPFSVVPAMALLYAFRATALAAEQRERSARLLTLSHVLAGRVDAEQMMPAFLSQCRQAFGADVALALQHPTGPAGTTEGSTVTVDDAAAAEQAAAEQPAMTGAALELLAAAGAEARVLTAPLPPGWTHALAAPLEADGQSLGVLVLASRTPSRPLGAAELTMLTPLAAALAVALRGAAHLRRLTEATSKLQAVVDQSSDGILVLDGVGRVQLWSPALGALTGHLEPAAVGRELGQVMSVLGPDGTPCDPFRVGADLLTPGSPQVTVELTVLRGDGEQRVVRCAHAGVFDGDVLTRDVVIVHDVTGERQVERLKADFIATVSHELRTPITPIKGYADLLRRKGDALTPERRAEYLGVISDRCDHLARLVEDLLLASRISATEGSAPADVSLVHDDLAVLVRRAAADFGEQCSRITLDACPPTPVTCDPVRTVQVLTNMIGNALKYSPADSQIAVRVGTEGGRAVVEVQDHGRGIPADQLERVFEKFHRVEDSMRMTTGGTGLGLYIARQLATAMGGSLHCCSTLNAGSTFRFTLPTADAAAPDRLAGQGEPRYGRPPVPAPRTTQAAPASP